MKLREIIALPERRDRQEFVPTSLRDHPLIPYGDGGASPPVASETGLLPGRG